MDWATTISEWTWDRESNTLWSNHRAYVYYDLRDLGIPVGYWHCINY